MGKLGMLIVHGQGSPEASYADRLTRRLSARLKEQWDDVEFRACHWSPILQQQQDRTWDRLRKNGNMGFKPVRRWVLSNLGDPACYLAGFFREDPPIYKQIHETVRGSLAEIENKIGGAAPLMVLAPSLGSIIVSNYFWDESHGHRIGQTPFQRMETLTSLITYGSTIPLFLPPTEPIQCIEFPSPQLPPHLRPVARWTNVFDSQDLLGYPLNDIWDEKHGTKIDDQTIDAGPLLVSWTPFSHNFYEEDDDFLKIVTDQVRAILAIP